MNVNGQVADKSGSAGQLAIRLFGVPLTQTDLLEGFAAGMALSSSFPLLLGSVFWAVLSTSGEVVIMSELYVVTVNLNR